MRRAGGGEQEIACVELLAQRSRHIAQLAALRQELATCQAEIGEYQTLTEGKMCEREELMRSCDMNRRQLVHLKGYRCNMKRAAGVLRGSASQLQLYHSHKGPAAAEQSPGVPAHDAAHEAIRQYFLQLVRRTFTAEGALVDESIRFLRSSGANLQDIAATLRALMTDSRCQLKTGMQDVRDPERREVSSTASASDPAATRKMRALLTLAHGQHIAAYEEVEALRIEAHEARARAEGRVAEVEEKLSQVATSDSEWRVMSISMKQDRDLAAARASVRVVQSRLNDMKIKVQIGKETSDRLHHHRSRLRTLEADIREARGRTASLQTGSLPIASLSSLRARLLHASINRL
jgi:hypothetical protein